MPSKRKYYRPRVMVSKNAVVTRVKKLEKKVKRFDPELKHFYRTPENIVFPNYNGNIYNLPAIPQDNTPNGRIGNQVRVNRLSVRYSIFITPGNNSQACRVIFFVDNANTLTTVNQILRVNGTVNATNSPYQDEERANFKILSDRTFSLVAFGGAQSGVSIHLNKKMDLPIHFEDTTTTIFKNNIKMLLISDVATSVCTFYAAYDVAYTDV